MAVYEMVEKLLKANDLYKDRIERFKRCLQIKLDELRTLGVSEARHREDEVNRRFLDTPAEPFVPCHRLPSV